MRSSVHTRRQATPDQQSPVARNGLARPHRARHSRAAHSFITMDGIFGEIDPSPCLEELRPGRARSRQTQSLLSRKAKLPTTV